MNTNIATFDPRQSAQIIGLGIHAVADRFSVHEEAFGKRLKELALELIEETVLYETAKSRDAAGTVRLIHQIIDRAEALRQLLSFVKHRGLAKPATVDNLDFELGRLLETLKREDAQFEDHVSRLHPHGVIIEAGPEPSLETGDLEIGNSETPKPSAKPNPLEETELYPLSHIPYPVDPLLGPDEAAPFGVDPRSYPRESASIASESEQALATAVLDRPQMTQAVPEDLPVAQQPTIPLTASSQIREDQRLDRRESAKLPQGGGLTDRQRKVLAIFHRETEAPLRRVMEVLPMFSEKTLRNDLKALVKRGKIKRVGRAPRSKYILVSS